MTPSVYRGVSGALLALVGVVGCGGDDADTNGATTSGGAPGDAPYVDVAGHWSRVEPSYLHLPSNHGEQQGAWSVGGTRVAYVVEDIGLQYVGKLLSYDASTPAWTELYEDVNAGAQLSFVEHADKLYMSANDFYTGRVFEVDGPSATVVTEVTWTNQQVRYHSLLASSGDALIQVRLEGNGDRVVFDERDGDGWVEAGAIESANVDKRTMRVMNGEGRVFVVFGEHGIDETQLHAFTPGEGVAAYATIGHAANQNRPKFATHGDVVHALVSSDEAPPNAFDRFVSVAPGGATTDIVTLPTTSWELTDLQSSSEGVFVTQTALDKAPLNGLLMWNGEGKPRSFALDSNEPPAAMGTVWNGAFYGGTFFWHEGQLEVVGNGHVGVSTDGGLAIKVYLARFDTL